MVDSDKIRHYVEDMTLLMEQMGFPRTAGRVLAFLLICDPPNQTMNDLMDALQMSKSSVSAATKSLIQMGFIERVSVPGVRRDFYRVCDNMWLQVMRKRADSLTTLRHAAERGLALIEDDDAARGNRLRQMRQLFLQLEGTMGPLLDEIETSS